MAGWWQLKQRWIIMPIDYVQILLPAQIGCGAFECLGAVAHGSDELITRGAEEAANPARTVIVVNGQAPRPTGRVLADGAPTALCEVQGLVAVSYTHLTLP